MGRSSGECQVISATGLFMNNRAPELKLAADMIVAEIRRLMADRNPPFSSHSMAVAVPASPPWLR